MRTDKLLDDNHLRDGFTGQYLAWKRVVDKVVLLQKEVDTLRAEIVVLKRQISKLEAWP